MTSSNGNIFHVTGPLCGEFTGHRWIPLTKASDTELWYFLWSAPWINGWANDREAGDFRRHRAHYDVITMLNHCRVGVYHISLPLPDAAYIPHVHSMNSGNGMYFQIQGQANVYFVCYQRILWCYTTQMHQNTIISTGCTIYSIVVTVRGLKFATTDFSKAWLRTSSYNSKGVYMGWWYNISVTVQLFGSTSSGCNHFICIYLFPHTWYIKYVHGVLSCFAFLWFGYGSIVKFAWRTCV